MAEGRLPDGFDTDWIFQLDDTVPDGSRCNFADKNAPEKFGHADREADDGYKYTSYPANGYGLTCQVTNV